MSDTPEGNICKVSANLGWASDTLAEVDKALLKLSAEVKTILRERDNFQDQRDFDMGEIERLRKERDEAREALRILFKDYKELADSGDAGFWELEDKEAAQPALRILQQREAAK